MQVQANAQAEQAIRTLHHLANYAAATELVLKHFGPEIQRFLVLRCRDDVRADEAFAEFSHDLWRGLPAFRWESTLRVWSYMLARNAMLRCAKRARRRHLREVELSEDIAPQEHLRAHTRTGTLPHLRTESRNRLAGLYGTLAEADQALLALRITRRLGWKEIAQVLSDIPPADAKLLDQEAARLRKRFQLVKARLRRIVQHDGVNAVDQDTAARSSTRHS